MKVNNSAEIRRRIDELKRRKRAVILAHYYTTPEVQEAADFLGDSLALSVKIAEFPILSFVIFILGYFFFLYKIKGFGKTLIL